MQTRAAACGMPRGSKYAAVCSDNQVLVDALLKIADDMQARDQGNGPNFKVGAGMCTCAYQTALHVRLFLKRVRVCPCARDAQHLALKRAADSVRAYPLSINSGREAQALKYVGKDTARRIEQILGKWAGEGSDLC